MAKTLVKCLSFMKETIFLPTLPRKSSDRTVSPNLDNNGYSSQQSQNTLPWPLFSWNGMVCSRNVFTKPWNYMETCFCDMKVWFWCQRLFSQCETWIVAASNLPGKLWFIYLSNKQQLWSSIWVFWKKHAACHSLAWKPSDSTVSLNQGSNRYGTHIHRTLFPDFFSHGMEHCVLGVLLQALKLQGKMTLWTWKLGTDGKTGFSPCESWIFAASNLPEKHTGSLFSLLQQQILSNIRIFWKKQMGTTSCWDSSNSTASPNQSKTDNCSQHPQTSIPWYLFS